MSKTTIEISAKQYEDTDRSTILLDVPALPLWALCCDDMSGPLGQSRVTTSATEMEMEPTVVRDDAHAIDLLHEQLDVDAAEVWVSSSTRGTTIRYRTA